MTTENKLAFVPLENIRDPSQIELAETIPNQLSPGCFDPPVPCVRCDVPPPCVRCYDPPPPCVRCYEPPSRT